MREEQRQAMLLLTQYIGVRGLYLRPGVGAPAELSGNMLQSLVRLHAFDGRLAGDVDCEFETLPFESDTFCMVYALHVVEGVDCPDRRVAEIARVLRPEGVAFLLCLSPLSPWRLRWGRRGLQVPSTHALRGWLATGGLSVEREAGLGSVLPWSGPASEAGWPAPCRAGRLLVARKRRPGVTAIPSRRRPLPVGAHAPV